MADILHETESLCPICLKKIPARYERIDGKAYMIKACPEHGEFKVLFWRDADMYERWMRQGVHAPAGGSRKSSAAPMTAASATSTAAAPARAYWR